jgi:hypothetical protein
MDTYSNTSTAESKSSSLFNYYVDGTYPGVMVSGSSGIIPILKIDRKTNTVN